MTTIRPFETTDKDYKAFALLQQAVWPEYPDTVDEWKHRDESRDPKYLFRRFVAERGGEMVASGLHCEPWWSMRPGKYWISIDVHPDHRRLGIASALYDYLLGLVTGHDPLMIISRTREDQTDALCFLDSRGFKQVMRFPVSYLDVPSFDPKPFADKVARVEALGIEIRPLAELTGEYPDWKRKLWDLDWELLQDVPVREPPTRQSFEIYEAQELGDPGFTLDGQIIALDAGRWVGKSGLWTAEGDPKKLTTGLTGVVRSHRRKGLATAMKVRSIAFARHYGARLIKTANEENNPMYKLNMQLGFEPQPAWLDFEKTIGEETEKGGRE
jgi:mycothiol synthase